MEKLNRITLLDDSKRPKAPKIENLTSAQRRHGRRLALYHNIHREQLNEVSNYMAQVETEIAKIAVKISELQMRNNYKVFGNLCGQECQMLSFHHSAEDSYVFPVLHEQGSAGLKKVIERLAAEHLVVHELIEELEAQANAALESPNAETFEKLKEIFKTLDKAVRSHFGYEETELEEALGIIEVGI
jgi:iron-sulfur cluster repair protein YtfE (RIC family)